MSKFDFSFISKFGVNRESFSIGVFPGVFSTDYGLVVFSIGFGVMLKILVYLLYEKLSEFY